MKILLLEDDTALNRAIKKVLELDNHIVSSFFDGDDVLNISSFNYDLYILDVNVPNINGLELLNIIYTQNPNSKIIIITSNTDEQTLTKAYNLGCIDYLQKPFHLAELRIKVEKLNKQKLDLLSSLKTKENESLTKKEKEFLSLLLENKGHIITYSMIEINMYQDKVMTMDGIRALVRRLRGKLEDNIIENVIDEGYRIK